MQADRKAPVSPVGPAKNMTYDNNGNLATVTNSCGTTTYTWDARNRLVGISGYKPDCTALTASFKYDAVGRRIEKTINGTTTKYLYDGLDIIQEKNQSGTVTANYIRTLSIDEPVTRVTGSTVRHYVKDALGSIIALTDDTGVVKTTYRYDPFGNVSVTGEASDNPLQYTGRENDGTGLYYYRARYYSPELQRFISEDPIGLLGGDVNYFAYVGNNPVNFVDPLGLWVLYGGGAGTGTVVRGKAGGTGIAFDSNNGGWGRYSCSGGSGGFGAGVGGEVGYYSGGMSGSTVTFTGGIGPWSVGVIFGQDGLGIVGGASVGVPFQATVSFEKCTFTPFKESESIKPAKCH